MQRSIGRRMLGGITVSAIAMTAHAQGAGNWTTKQTANGNARTAAAIAAGPLRMLEIGCNGATPTIGIGAPLDARVASIPVRFSAPGTNPIVLAMRRLGTSQAFAAPAPGRALLDLMIAHPTVTIEIAGRSIAFDSRGAAPAFRTALAPCYSATEATPARPVADAAGSGGDAETAADPMADLILLAAPPAGARPMTRATFLQRATTLTQPGRSTPRLMLGELWVIAGDDSQPRGAMDHLNFTNAPVAPGSTRMKSRPYDVLAALRTRGVTLTPFYCYLTDGQRTEHYRAAATSKAPFWIQSVNWPARGGGSNYVLAIDVSYAPAPTAREIEAGMEETPRRCPS